MKYVAKHGMSDLGQVRGVIDNAYASYATRLSDYSPKLEWKTEREAIVSFAVWNKILQANFALNEEEIRITGEVPLLFRAFQGRIEKVLGEEVERWLAKARAAERV